jgi:hypothetical protein
MILGGSEALFEGAGGAREPVWRELHEETLSILQQGLGDDLTGPRQQGSVLALDELVAYALQFMQTTRAPR